MPGRHPDDDVLADLAADVLPLEQARAVEAHVLQCDRCAGLLSDAEHVRSLLLADDPGPVPSEIWERIEAALGAAGTAQTGSARSGSTLAGSAAAADLASTVPLPPEPGPRRAPTAPSGWDGPDPLDDPDRWDTPVRRPVAAQPPASGNVRSLSTSRRDVRTDRRRPPLALLLGAAAVAAVVVGAGAVRLVTAGTSSGSSASGALSQAADAGGSAGANSAGGAGAVRITRSGLDYTSSTLSREARTLVRGSALAAQSSARSESDNPPNPTVPRASSPARSQPLASVAPDPKATDVTNPQRLTACLTALGAGSDVVAVDLARYQGREAAVLVVRTESGYEVWVVERTCAPGNEGALAETTLPR
jgi:hypothetical protein